MQFKILWYIDVITSGHHSFDTSFCRGRCVSAQFVSINLVQEIISGLTTFAKARSKFALTYNECQPRDVAFSAKSSRHIVPDDELLRS